MSRKGVGILQKKMLGNLQSFLKLLILTEPFPQWTCRGPVS